MKGHFDYRALKAFVAVAREKNVTRAADQLNLTQPAVSLQMKRLTKNAGVSLFRRTSKGIELTRDGTVLAAKAEQVLAAMMDFEQTARHLTSQLRGTLRVGTTIDPEFTRLGTFLNALVTGAPGIRTELQHGMSGDVPVGLLRNELDVGYFLGDIEQFEPSRFSQAPDCRPTFYLQRLAKLTYRVVAPAALSGMIKEKGWKELADLPWIGTPPASIHNRLLAPLFKNLDVGQNVVALVDQESSMLAMVRANVGLSLAREAIALHEQQANGLAMADEVKLETDLSFVCLSARISEPMIKLAFRLIAEIWPHIHQ
jgi:DNA-binding transcriptional LysR family regulator